MVFSYHLGGFKKSESDEDIKFRLDFKFEWEKFFGFLFLVFLFFLGALVLFEKNVVNKGGDLSFVVGVELIAISVTFFYFILCSFFKVDYKLEP